MRHRILKTLLLTASIGIAISWCIAKPAVLSRAQIAKQLGWVEQKNAYNLCNGYYLELPINYIPNTQVQSQSDNYNINADRVIVPLKQGPYVFKKNVVVTQIGRQLKSDLAYGYRDKKTGKVSLIKTIGNVRLRAPNKLILAERASFNVKTKKILLHNLHYRLNRGGEKTIIIKNKKTGATERHIYQLSAHGEAKTAQHTNNKITTLKNATYSTCQPNHCQVWMIKGSTIKLDSNKGRGEAWNTMLFLKGIPVFYFPYFNFPIDHKRHTGFLTPKFGISSRKGLSLDTPYYWNIAPNYDALITPNFMQKRGVLLQGLFRYLLPNSNGQIGAGYLPNDHEFKKFKKKNPQATGSNNRKNFFFKNTTNINKHLSASVDYNYVGDDYFIRDLGGNLLDSSNNQLLRQAKISYTNNIWSFFGNAQSYQTLHPVNQANISNQYARLPQLQLNANFPEHPAGLYFGLNSEFTRFSFTRNPYPDTTSIVGQSTRANFKPFVSLPLNWPFAYITPRAQFQLTSYNVQNPLFGAKKSPHLAVPIFDIKSGMFFDRDANFSNHKYQQTLEPTIYYLYVPYHNQNNIPYFDTSSQSFNYDFMFLDNRFAGIDRVGDANQTTLGLTSRLINEDSGDEKALVSIGRIYYFQDRRVTLCYNNTCPANNEDQQHLSPIAALGTYHFNPHLSANAAATWSSKTRAFDNRDIGMQYLLDSKHIINVDYNYAKQGNVIAGVPAGSSQNDLKQTNISGYWKINKHWSIMGRWNYSWSHAYNQAYMYGVAYDSCCWAIRLVTARTFTAVGPAPDYTKQYDQAYYVEIALKGLDTVANVDSGDFLAQSIAGYSDTFAQENRL